MVPCRHSWLERSHGHKDFWLYNIIPLPGRLHHLYVIYTVPKAHGSVDQVETEPIKPIVPFKCSQLNVHRKLNIVF